MKKILSSVILLFLGSMLYAQQDAMFTHYAFNTLAVNPAYAGSRDALTVTGLHRSQWVGFDGAPVTQTLTLHTPILKDKLGVGLSILNDKIGPTNMTSLYLDLAYRLKVSAQGTLAFGLKGGLNMGQANLTELETEVNGDQSFDRDLTSGVLPNFGVGVYYYTPKFYVGVSTPKLIENAFKGNSSVTDFDSGKEKRHFFAIAGTVFSISDHVKLKPTTYLKVTEAAPLELDLTGMFIFHEKFELGAMFRTGDAVGALIGYNINSQFRIGYSFDYSYKNTTFKYNGGSHEIMLRYDAIFNETKKIRSPRYF